MSLFPVAAPRINYRVRSFRILQTLSRGTTTSAKVREPELLTSALEKKVRTWLSNPECAKKRKEAGQQTLGCLCKQTSAECRLFTPRAPPVTQRPPGLKQLEHLLAHLRDETSGGLTLRRSRGERNPLLQQQRGPCICRRCPSRHHSWLSCGTICWPRDPRAAPYCKQNVQHQQRQ